MTLKISFSEVQAAQNVVAGGVEQMETLTKQILASAGASAEAMKAPAGQITSETFGDLGGGGRALAEALSDLHNDLNTLQSVAAQGSEEASREARSGAVGSSAASTAVSSGM